MTAAMPERRVWLSMKPRDGGGAVLSLSRLQPADTASTVAILRSRGVLDGDVELTIPPMPAGVTNEQIAAAVQTYLTAHPPAAGRAPTSAEIASAVAAWFAANPPVTKVEFAISLVDAYAVGVLTGGAEKRIACAGLKTTDALSVQATAALPAGYAGLCVSCTENGFARVGFVRPALGIGVSNTIPLRITAIR